MKYKCKYCGEVLFGLEAKDAHKCVDRGHENSKDMKKELKFIATTDTVDIAAKSIGVHTMNSLDSRGLCIQIRHNGNKELFDLAVKMSKIIEKALNDEKLS